MDKNILIISPEPWDHIFVSKHHYAIEIAKKNNRVFFLNPPISRRGLSVRQLDDESAISVIDYTSPVKGQRFLPGFLRRFIDAYFLKKIEQSIGCKIDVIWNFENSRFFDFKFAPDKVLKIYHQVDLNQKFNLATAARTADICFCTTELIRQDILPHNKMTFKIHHGVTKNAFLSNGILSRPSSATITASYIGNLDMSYLDLDLLENVIKTFPKVIFQFVGPYSQQKEFYVRISKYPNINLIGRVDSKELPHYLYNSDILMVLYQQKHHKDQASPHKVVEYMASGKIIVSTYMDEYKDKDELLAMSKDNSEYLAIFNNVVSNIDQYNSKAEQEKRIAFAREQTYAKQVDRILKLINSYVPQKATPV